MKNFGINDFALTVFTVIVLLNLTGCATKLDETHQAGIWKLHTRCGIEMQQVLRTDDREFTAEFCKHYLGRIAPSQSELNDLGGDEYVSKATQIYKNKVLIALALNRGNAAEIHKLPLKYSTETAKEIDEVFDHTKKVLYENYIDNKVNREVASAEIDK